MSLFEKVEDSIRVEVIGSDGIRRVGYYSRDTELVANRYRVDPDHVFLTKVKRNMFSTVQQPTIIFRENHSEPVPYRVEPSKPSPREVGDAVSRAAWALSQLLISKEEKWKFLLLLFAGLAIAAGGAAAYMSYETGLRLTDFENRFIAAVESANPDVVIPTPTVTTGPTVKPTPLPSPTIIMPTPVGVT